MNNPVFVRFSILLLFVQLLFGSEDARPLQVKVKPQSSSQVSVEISPGPPTGIPLTTFAQPRDPNRVPVISAPCYTEIFELTHYDARCVSIIGVLFRGQGFPECKTMCLRQDICGFVVLYSNGRCEGFADCGFMTPFDEKRRALNGVRVFSRLSECQLEIFFGQGRYVKEIAKHFHGVAIVGPQNRNLHCICMNGRLASCVIFVKPGSEEEKVVQRILDRNNPQPPFYLTEAITPEQAPIVFSMQRKNTNIDVIAEITYLSPIFCIHISICYDGTPNKLCPITNKYFRAGEPVWVLNSDVSAVHRRSAVPCLSDVGVRQISLTPANDNLQYTRFFDPLGRQPSQKLLPNEDYTLFFVFDDRYLQTGLCQGAPEMRDELSTLPSEIVSEGTKKKKSRGGKKKKKAVAIDSSDLESGASMSSSGTLQLDSPTPDLPGLSLQDQASDRPSSSEQHATAEPSSRVLDVSQQKLQGKNLETEVAFSRTKLARISSIFVIFIIAFSGFFTLFFIIRSLLFTSLPRPSGDFLISLFEEDL